MKIKNILLLISIVIFVLLYIKIIYLPINSKIINLRNEHLSYSSKIDMLKPFTSKEKELESKINALKLELYNQENVGDRIIEDINNAIINTAVKVSDISIKKDESNKNIYNISINLSGNYMDISDFIKRLENSSNRYIVKSIKGLGTNDALSIVLNISFE
jgi:Tfp pilus assembly protein PilO